MKTIKERLAAASPLKRQQVRARMQLAARIEEAMEKKGWTQKQLADALGKVPSQVSKWLSGTHNFELDTLITLQTVLDVKLLCVEDEKPREVVKHEVRYQTILVMVNPHHTPNGFVTSNSFSKAIGQTQVNA